MFASSLRDPRIFSHIFAYFSTDIFASYKVTITLIFNETMINKLSVVQGLTERMTVRSVSIVVSRMITVAPE